MRGRRRFTVWRYVSADERPSEFDRQGGALGKRYNAGMIPTVRQRLERDRWRMNDLVGVLSGRVGMSR